jgi:hypothetical protein
VNGRVDGGKLVHENPQGTTRRHNHRMFRTERERHEW